LEFGLQILSFDLSFLAFQEQSPIHNQQSKMKKAMGDSPMAFGTFDEQVVSDRQRQWAARKGTKGAVALG
jgi:hypothetical protein